jgi:hypothetical protein
MGDIAHLLKPQVKSGVVYSPTAILRELYTLRDDYARLMGNELPFGISPQARQAAINVTDRPTSSMHSTKAS